jgi:S1-C subfamily serine protease
MLRSSLTASALLACLLAAPLARGADDTASVGAVAEHLATRSVVRVRSTVRLEGAPVRMRADEATFSNTGFFVSTDGEVLTSLLALAGCSQIDVFSADGRTASARVKALDQPSGLALLQTDLTDTMPFEAALAPPTAGRRVLVASAATVGGAVRLTLSPGLVAEGRESVRVHGLEWRELLPATCVARPGSAAAPVLDDRGRLVGVVLGSVASPAGAGPRPGCYVLPLAQIEPIVERMRNGESRRLGWLGAIVAAAPEGGRGVCVLETMNGAPAALAGLRRGDVLLEADGRQIERPDVLAECVARGGPGEVVQLLVQRGEATETVALTVEPRPLLICGGMGRPGGKVVRVRWNRSVGAIRLPGRADGSEEVLFQLLDENEELRARVRELEEEVARLQD